MPDQCRRLYYDDIKNIIIDTLHAKCMSKRIRKSLIKSVDVTKRICNLPLNHDEERWSVLSKKPNIKIFEYKT